MNEMEGLIWAHRLDGQGGSIKIDSVSSTSDTPVEGVIWSHWDRKHDGTKQWIREQSGLNPLICEALLAEETRPRCLFLDDGLFAILRGVNLNPGANPEDMISVRVWIDSKRIITLRGPRIMATQEISDDLNKGSGPCAIGDFLSELASSLIEKMGPVLDDLNDQVDEIEEKVLELQSSELRSKLGHFRRMAISLRRYLAPQREVLSRLQTERVDWITDIHRARIREASERLTRYIEDLDAIRERAAVTQEELAGRLSEQMNSRMYLLSLVAGIFLPLGLLTGLLGINVGGIPGTENDFAFALVCVILVACAVVGAWLLRRFRFF